MVYKREDGRKSTETRPMEAKVGIIPNAVGSAMFKIGKTVAYAAVYGPRELYPRFLQDPSKGLLRCNYNMMPFASSGERSKPGPNRRSKEISLITEKALAPVVDLSKFPNAVVDVFVELPQCDAGSRCAGICAASMALADAGIGMKDLVAAVAVGRVEDQILVDLNYIEDSYEGGTDLPMAIIPSTGQITLLQMDGLMTKEQLKQAFELATQTCKKINEVQKAALKKKFEVQSQ